MFPFRIVEHFDVVEHISPCLVTGSISASSDPFAFEQVEEALSDCIVMAITTPAHGVLQIVMLEERCPIHAGEL